MLNEWISDKTDRKQKHFLSFDIFFQHNAGFFLKIKYRNIKKNTKRPSEIGLTKRIFMDVTV